MEYRSRSHIVVSILKAVADTGKNSNGTGLKHTEIMRRTAIPDIYLKAYMQLLQQKALTEYDSQQQIFTVTEKGIQYLNLNNEINNILVKRRA